MARLYQTGFELNSATSGVEQDTWSGVGATIQTGTVQTGTYAMKATTSSGTRQGCVIQFASAASNGPYYFRIYFNIATAPTNPNGIIALSNGAAITSGVEVYAHVNSSRQVTLLYNNAGTLTQLGSASSAIPLNTWTRLELKFDKSGGAGANVVEASINGSVFATASNLTVQAGIESIRIGTNMAGNTDTTGVIYFDDMAINDSTGASQTGYPGAGQIVHVQPNAQGDANGFLVQVGGTAGSANNYTRVKEVTPDDATSYNASNVLNAQDLFTVGSSGLTGSPTINTVCVGVRVANITAIDNQTTLKAQIEKTSGGTITSSAGITPDVTTWETNNSTTRVSPYPLVLYNDPDGSAWTTTTLGTMEIGYQLTTAHTDAIGVSTIWVSIDYVSGAAPVAATGSTLMMMGVG